MSENAPPEQHPAGNGEAQPTQEAQETTNEPQISSDNTAQQPTTSNGNTEQSIADSTEQSATNGASTPVDSAVQTEPMSADVINGSQPTAESMDKATASSTSQEPDSRPAVLIVGGLGMLLECVILGMIPLLIQRQGTSVDSSPTISTKTNLHQPCG